MKITKHSNQDSWSAHLDLNQAPTEYEAGIIIIIIINSLLIIISILILYFNVLTQQLLELILIIIIIIIIICKDREPGSSVSIVSGYGLDDRAIEVRSPAETKGPTQPSVQWVPGVLSPGLKRGRGVTLTIHPHLVPKSRMSRSYTCSSPIAFVTCCGTDF
jgi:hypothetical protein